MIEVEKALQRSLRAYGLMASPQLAEEVRPEITQLLNKWHSEGVVREDDLARRALMVLRDRIPHTDSRPSRGAQRN